MLFGCPFPCPLVREGRLFLQPLFVSVCVGISRSPASPVPSVRQEENPENVLPCHSLGAEIPGWSAIFSPLCRVLFGLFYM